MIFQPDFYVSGGFNAVQMTAPCAVSMQRRESPYLIVATLARDVSVSLPLVLSQCVN